MEAIAMVRSRMTGGQEKEKAAQDTEYNNFGQNSGMDLDLFEEARRCIGLYPVESSHILKHHDGNYEISTEDIPRHHNLRDRAAKEFLKEELNWQILAKTETKWSRDRNILWLTFQDEKLVSSIFKKQAEKKW